MNIKKRGYLITASVSAIWITEFRTYIRAMKRRDKIFCEFPSTKSHCLVILVYFLYIDIFLAKNEAHLGRFLGVN